MRENEPVRFLSTPVVTALSEIPAVRGILCFGSYAMGTYDEDSDIDLYVLCVPRIISAAERDEAFTGITGLTGLEVDRTDPGWQREWNPANDCFSLNDLSFDILYNTVDWLQTVVRKVREQGDTTIPEQPFRPYSILGLLESSIVLYDPDTILRDLIDNLYPYPENLKNTIVENNLAALNDSIEELRNYVERGIGNTAFQFEFRNSIDALTQLLFAVNERYDPATKRTEGFIRTLPLLPEHFADRYDRLLMISLTTGGRKEIVRELQAFLTEIVSLSSG